jgi:hypothetical protein
MTNKSIFTLEKESFYNPITLIGFFVIIIILSLYFVIINLPHANGQRSLFDTHYTYLKNISSIKILANPYFQWAKNNSYIVWLKGYATENVSSGYSKVKLRISADNGESFNKISTISNDNYKNKFSHDVKLAIPIKIDGYDESKNNITLYNSRIYTSKIENISNGVGLAANPQIAVVKDNIFIIWSDKSSGAYNLFLIKSADSGNTFGNPLRLTLDNRNSLNQHIATSGNKLYLVWQKEGDLPKSAYIMLKKGFSNATTFEPTVNLSNATSYSSDPQIAVSGSKVYVVWQGHNNTSGNSDILFKASKDNATTFEPTVNLSNATSYSSDPQIAVSGSKVYVVWDDSRPIETSIKNNEISIRQIGNDESGSEGIFNIYKTNSNILSNVEIAYRGDNLYIVFINNTLNDNYQLYFAKIS